MISYVCYGPLPVIQEGGVLWLKTVLFFYCGNVTEFFFLWNWGLFLSMSRKIWVRRWLSLLNSNDSCRGCTWDEEVDVRERWGGVFFRACNYSIKAFSWRISRAALEKLGAVSASAFSGTNAWTELHKGRALVFSKASGSPAGQLMIFLYEINKYLWKIRGLVLAQSISLIIRQNWSQTLEQNVKYIM